MKYLILVFSLICSIGYGQNIAPSQFEGSPYSGGYLKAVVKIWDDAILDSVYVYQHAPSEFSRIDSMTFANDTLSIYTIDSVFQVEILSGGGGGTITGNGTTNMVAYWASSDSLTHDTMFSYLPASDRLGLGIDIPTGLGVGLHLNGGTFTDLHLTNPTTGTTAADGTSLFISSSDAYLTNRENGDVVIATQNIERIRVNETGTVNVSSLDTDGTAPTTSGTTRKVISDANGLLSFKTDTDGTVTSVGLTTGTSGTDINVSGSPVTSSGTFTLNIPTASGSNRGALSSADWTTFNNKVGGSGTSTRVAFWSGSNTLSSNANLFWDNTNSRLGIGTTSPGGLLGLYSSGATQTLEFNRTGGWHQSEITNYYDSFTNKGLRLGGNASYGQTTMPNVLTINNYNNNSGGRIGIETDDPQSRLHLTVPYFTNSEDGIRMDNGSVSVRQQINNDGDLIFRTTSGHMTIGKITSSIQTSDPAASIHLYGSSVSSGSEPFIRVEKNGLGSHVVWNHQYTDFENTGSVFSDSDFDFITLNTFRNRVGIGLGAAVPTRLMDINGELRVRDLVTTTPSWLMAADNDGVASRVQVSTGLQLVGNTLSVNGVGTVSSISGANGIVTSPNPIVATGTVNLTGQALALHNLATNGIIARTGAGTVAARTITSGDGISMTNGDGVSGNPTITASGATVGGLYLTGDVDDFSYSGTYKIVDWDYTSVTQIDNGGVTINATAGTITVTSSGTYEISYHASIGGNTGTYTNEFRVYKNGASIGRQGISRQTVAATVTGNYFNQGATFTVDLAQDDVISLYYARTQGSQTYLNIHSAGLTVKRIY